MVVGAAPETDRRTVSVSVNTNMILALDEYAGSQETLRRESLYYKPTNSGNAAIITHCVVQTTKQTAC